MRRGLALIAAIAAVGAIAAPIAAAAPANILAGDPSPMATNPDVFNPTSYNHDAGTVASLTWVAGGAHDADATVAGPDGGALFRTELIRSGTVPVPGTQYLPLGVHPFICTVHAGMAGNLNVNAGTPLPRPAVRLKLISKKLDQVMSSSKLRVRVTIEGGSGEPAAVEAKLGKRTLAAGTAAATKTLSLRLPKKARAELEDRNKAKLKLAAEVDFGSPAKGSGTLR